MKGWKILNVHFFNSFSHIAMLWVFPFLSSWNEDFNQRRNKKNHFQTYIFQSVSGAVNSHLEVIAVMTACQIAICMAATNYPLNSCSKIHSVVVWAFILRKGLKKMANIHILHGFLIDQSAWCPSCKVLYHITELILLLITENSCQWTLF